MNGNFEYSFEYDEDGLLSKVIEKRIDAVITTNIKRHDNGSPSRVSEYYAEYMESEKLNSLIHTRDNIYYFSEDGRTLAILDYNKDELSVVTIFEYDADHRKIHEKYINIDYPEYNGESTYIYNDDGYIVRKNNVLDANSYKEYTHLEKYSKVFVCGIYEYPDRTSKDCETFELIH